MGLGNTIRALFLAGSFLASGVAAYVTQNTGDHMGYEIPEAIPEVTFSRYKSLTNNKKPTIIEISKTDCAPCILIDQELENIVDAYDGQIDVVKVTADTNPDYQKIAKHLGVYEKIDGAPTLIFIADGSIKLRDGYQDTETLKDYVTEIFGLE